MKENKLKQQLYKASRVSPSTEMKKNFEQKGQSVTRILYPAFAIAFSLLVMLILSPPLQHSSSLTYQDLDNFIDHQLQYSEQFDQAFVGQMAIDNEYQMMDTDSL